MYRTLSLRFGIMFVMIYFAIFFDPMKCEFVWDMQSGICNEFDFEAGQCLSIENPKIFSEILKDAKETVFQNNSELYFVVEVAGRDHTCRCPECMRRRRCGAR